MRLQGQYQEAQPINQPWRNVGGLYLALVLSVDPATGTCGVELEEGSQPVAAHVVSPNANSSNGWVWLPQQGDLVVVGFLQKNSSMPVILGSLYAVNDTKHATNPEDMTLRHKSGTNLIISQDGTATLTGKAGAFVQLKANGDVEVKHSSSSADVSLNTNGVDIQKGTVKAHVGSDKVLLDANTSGAGATIEVLPSGAINITPGPGSIINLANGSEFVCKGGDVTSSPIGPVPDHYHLLIPSSTKVLAG
jgi:phage baseplate assembly protein gpV